MKNKFLINIREIKEIEEYKKVGVTTFLFPLASFCVGYDKEYSLEDVQNIQEENKYILINRVLDCASVDSLYNILKDVKNIKGIVFEDIAIYKIVKNLKLDLELIYFPNHFNTNVSSVNFFLKRVDSVFISNELTKEEMSFITENAMKEVVIQVFGHNQAMYSRRKLLTNFSTEFLLPLHNPNTLVERVSKISFKAFENEYGTVLYSGKIFNGFELLSLSNVKYFYINTTFIPLESVLKTIKNITSNLDTDKGFLEKETIYKLKEVEK